MEPANTQGRVKEKNQGDQLANFKLSDGDYGGIAGWFDLQRVKELHQLLNHTLQMILEFTEWLVM